MREKIQSALETPDGAWRVEVVSRGSRSVWYRIVHGGDVIDWLTITGVERILTGAKVNMADLRPADANEQGKRSGAA